MSTGLQGYSMSFNIKFMSNKVGALCLIALVFLITTQVVFFLELRKAQEQSQDRVAKTHDTINVIEEIFTKIKNIELWQYDYLLTGDEKVLRTKTGDILAFGENMATSLSMERRSINNGLNKVENLTKDNIQQKNQIATLRILLNKKLDFIAETIELSRANKLSTAQAITRISQGKDLMKNIRANVAQIILTEKKILFIRETEDSRSSNHLIQGIIIAVVTSYLLLLITILVIRVNFMRIAKAEEHLHAKDINFKNTIQSNKDAVFLIRAVDADFSNIKSLVIDYLNPAAEKMTGFRSYKANNQLIENIFPKTNKIEMTNMAGYYNNIRSQNQSMLTEYTITEGPWKDRHVQEQITPLPDGMTISIRDITKS